MSWNLPDGTSDADIDAAFGDSDDTAERITTRLTDAGWPDDDAQEYVDSLSEGALLDWADDPWTLPSHASWLADKWWSGWNPYWVAWAAELGTTPDDPALTGYRFTPWINDRWREFDAANGRTQEHARDDAEHTAFGAWLQDRATGRAVPSAPGRTCPTGSVAGGAPIANTTQGA